MSESKYERHRLNLKAIAQARHAAIATLIYRHRAEYDELKAAERVKRGLEPRTVADEKSHLLARIADLEAMLKERETT